MNQAEIEAKLVELALLYEQQGADSAAVKELSEALAKENTQNVGKARLSLGRKVMLKKVTVRQNNKDVAVDIKSGTVSQVMQAVEAARNNTVDTPVQTGAKSSTTKNKSKDLSQLDELMANAAKEKENQPAKPKDQPAAKKQKATDKPKDKPAKQVKKDEVQTKPDNSVNTDAVLKEVDDYIYGRAARYSGAITDFAKDKENTVKLLGHLSSEFAKRPKASDDKIKRRNLFKLAVIIGAKNFNDEDVKQSLSGLLQRISEVSQNDFVKHQKDKDKDDFLLYIPTVEKVVTKAGMTDFINNIANTHARELYGKLDDESKEKYMAWLADYSAKAEERAKAQNEAENQAQAEGENKKDTSVKEENNTKPTQQDEQTGDTTMTDEVLTQEQIDELKKYNKDIDLSGITPENYAEKLEAAKKAAEENASGAGNPDTAPTDKQEENEDNKDGKEGDTENKEKEGNSGLNIDGEGEKKPEPKTNEEDLDWIEQKKRDYQERADKKEIAGYTWDETVKDGFAAHVEGGYIHYTSKDSVIVSKESGLKVFEALVTEKHNVGRPVNFGTNLDHDQAVKLLAACLIHGNEVGDNPPKLSAEDIKLLEAELKGRTTTVDGKEVPLFEVLKPQLEKYAEGKEGKEDKKENTDIGNDDPKTFDEETKGKIKEALEHQYKLSFLEAKGVAVKDEKGDVKKADSADQKDYEEYVDLKNKTIRVGDKEISEKDFLAEKFKENPAEVRAIVGSVVEDMHKEKIASIREKMAKVNGAKEGTTQLDEHNEMRQAKLEERAKKDHDISVALGIIEPNDEDKKAGKGALSGDELDKFVADNKVDKFTYERLTDKSNGKALYDNGTRNFDEKKLSKEQKEVFDKLPMPQSIAREKGGRE